MKTVGVKVLKNNLSKYLKLVRQGETILVKDRDRVIAELRPPQPASAGDRFRTFLEEEARLGRVRLAASHDSKAFEALADLPRPEVPIDVQALMDEIREDR